MINLRIFFVVLTIVIRRMNLYLINDLSIHLKFKNPKPQSPELLPNKPFPMLIRQHLQCRPCSHKNRIRSLEQTNFFDSKMELRFRNLKSSKSLINLFFFLEDWRWENETVECVRRRTAAQFCVWWAQSTI